MADGRSQEFLPMMPVMVLDFVSSESEASMSNEQFGAYWRLLLRAWMATPACTLPDDDTALARIARMSLHRWRSIGLTVRAKFLPAGDGRIRNERQWLVYLEACTRNVQNQARTAAANAARREPRHKARHVARHVNVSASIHKHKQYVPSVKITDGRTPIDEWCDRWGNAYPGDRYEVGPHGGKYGANLKRLEKALGRDELLARFDRYLASRDEFYVNARHDLGVFISQINRFGETPRSKPQPRTLSLLEEFWGVMRGLDWRCLQGCDGPDGDGVVRLAVTDVEKVKDCRADLHAKLAELRPGARLEIVEAA